MLFASAYDTANEWAFDLGSLPDFRTTTGC